MSQTNIQTLQRNLSVVIEELDRQNEMDSCIFAYTVVEEVLQELGISEVYPLTVRPIIRNPNLTKAFDQENLTLSEIPDDEYKARGYAQAEFGQGVPNSDRWPAHLVAIIPNTFNENAALLDLTLAQFNVVKFNIKLCSTLSRVSARFLFAQEVCRLTVNDCAIIYQAEPQNLSFKQTSLWKDRTKQRLTSEAILSKIS